VTGVSVVFADVFDQFRIRHDLKLHREGPCTGLGLWIVDGHPDFHVSEIHTAKSFDGVHGIAVWMAGQRRSRRTAV
jgi:hypothetical protein